MTKDTKDDGGPAFPHQGQITNWSTDPLATPKTVQYPGISLRDYFAGKSLAGIRSLSLNGKIMPSDEAVELALKDADAMLKARKGK